MGTRIIKLLAIINLGRNERRGGCAIYLVGKKTGRLKEITAERKRREGIIKARRRGENKFVIASRWNYKARSWASV